MKMAGIVLLLEIGLVFILRCGMFDAYIVQISGVSEDHGDSYKFSFVCSSSYTPLGCSVEFLANNQTLAILTVDQQICYIGNERNVTCTPELCSCSSDCRRFTFHYITEKAQYFPTYACEMKFGVNIGSFERSYVDTNFNGNEFVPGSSFTANLDHNETISNSTNADLSKSDLNVFEVTAIMFGITAIVVFAVLSAVFINRKRGQCRFLQTLIKSGSEFQPMLEKKPELIKTEGDCQAPTLMCTLTAQSEDIRYQLLCQECSKCYCALCSLDHVQTMHKVDKNRSSIVNQGYELQAAINVLTFPKKTNSTSACGLCILDDERIVLCDSNTMKISVFSTKEFLFSKLFAMKPGGITTMHQNKVAVTFTKAKLLSIFNIEQNQAIQVQTFKIKGHPRSITYNEHHYAVEVENDHVYFVYILNQKCDTLHAIRCTSLLYSTFPNTPVSLALDAQKKMIYVVDFQRQITCLDYSGAIKWHEEKTSLEHLVSLHQTGNCSEILISSSKECAIYHYRINKTEYHTFDVTTETLIKFKNRSPPNRIATNHKNNLFCVTIGDNEVHIYRLRALSSVVVENLNNFLYTN